MIFLFIILFINTARNSILKNIIKESTFNYIENKKWILFIFTILIGNIISNSIKATNAFEVYINDKLLWSKLKSGSVPDINNIINKIKSLNIKLN